VVNFSEDLFYFLRTHYTFGNILFWTFGQILYVLPPPKKKRMFCSPTVTRSCSVSRWSILWMLLQWNLKNHTLFWCS